MDLIIHHAWILRGIGISIPAFKEQIHVPLGIHSRTEYTDSRLNSHFLQSVALLTEAFVNDNMAVVNR